MSNVIKLFPELTREMLDSLNYTPKKPIFSYINSENTSVELELYNYEMHTNGISAQLRDQNASWDPEKYETVFETSIEIKNLNTLFGPTGIAPNEAEIGIGILWIDTKAEQRGIIPVGNFKKQQQQFNIIVTHTFPKGLLKGNLLLQTCLFLQNPGKPQKRETFLASEPGTVLGLLDNIDIMIEGNGSVFPILLLDEPGGLLWNIHYNEDIDPCSDSFSEENICINLNKAHPAYELISMEKPLKDNPLLLEILSAALVLICSKVKENFSSDWESLISGSIEYEEGSIAQAICYFRNKLRWDFTDQISLSISIRSFLEKQFRGDSI